MSETDKPEQIIQKRGRGRPKGSKNKKVAKRKRNQSGRLANGLSPQYVKFLDCYFQNGFNGQAAARDAGYCKPYNTSAWRILHIPAVQKELERRLDSVGLSTERIIAEIAQVALGTDLADFAGVVEGGETLEALRDKGVDTRLLKAYRRTVTKDGGSVHIEVQDRLKALLGLAKIRGLIDQGQAPPPAPEVRADVLDAVTRLLAGIGGVIDHSRGYVTPPAMVQLPAVPEAEAEPAVDVEAEELDP